VVVFNAVLLSRLAEPPPVGPITAVRSEVFLFRAQHSRRALTLRFTYLDVPDVGTQAARETPKVTSFSKCLSEIR
jgi:hypothetical protein